MYPGIVVGSVFGADGAGTAGQIHLSFQYIHTSYLLLYRNRNRIWDTKRLPR